MSSFRRIVSAISLAAVLFAAAPLFADEYSFQVTNKTRLTIKKILVSEDGEEYGFFDIGQGIRPGATVDLVWDSSTDGESCEQYVKAVYADGSESEPATFDFCESELALEFE